MTADVIPTTSACGSIPPTPHRPWSIWHRGGHRHRLIVLAAGGHYARLSYMQARGVDFDHVPSVESWRWPGT